MSPGMFYSFLYVGMILLYVAGITLALFVIFRVLLFLNRKEKRDARILELLEDISKRMNQ
jgi:hypothetical protein